MKQKTTNKKINKTKKEHYDFITIGSATIDAFLTMDDSETEVIKIIHPLFDSELIAYPLGSKLIIKDMTFEIGGGGTNSAVSISKLGFKTAFYGCVGKDNNGDKVLELLKQNNIDFIGKRFAKNGFSVILDSFVKERTILTHKGANDYVDQNITYTAKAVYSSALTGKSLELQPKLFKKLKRQGSIIFYNPSSYVVKKGLQKLTPILQHVDFLILNLEEVQTLINEKSLVKIFEQLTPKFKSLIVTNGKDGAYFWDNGIYHIETHHKNAKETTGAGDAFGSTFAAYFMKTKNIKKAIKYASLNAESVINKIGAKKGLLSEKEIELRFKKSSFNIKKIK